MTSKQFCAALDMLKLTQTGAAKILDANDRTVRRWASDERSVPKQVGILLRLMLHGVITPADIEASHDK